MGSLLISRTDRKMEMKTVDLWFSKQIIQSTSENEEALSSGVRAIFKAEAVRLAQGTEGA